MYGNGFGFDSIGSTKLVFTDLKDLEARFSQLRILEHSEQMNMPRFPALLEAEWDPQATDYFATPDESPIYIDEFPRVEYLVQRGFFERRTANFWILFDELHRPRPLILLRQYLSNRRLEQRDFHALPAFSSSMKMFGQNACRLFWQNG